MRITITMIPQDIINAYNLIPLVKNGHVLIKICKGMPSPPQTGKIVHGRLVEHLSNFLYFPARHTPGIWHHATHDI